jgi:uncharacterized protein (DUF305 family)
MTAVTTSPRRLNIFSTWGLALMLVIGLALGYGAGLLTPSSTPGDSSAEAGFARDMSSHHAQAVEMGMIAAAKATRIEVRVMGADIALTQQGQIGMMNQWLRDWRLNLNASDHPMAWMPDGKQALENGRMPGMATPTEMDQLRAATGKDVDRLFLQMMTKHHLGGIHMVEGVLAQSHNPDVIYLATTMKDGQQGEITAMQALLKSIGTN